MGLHKGQCPKNIKSIAGWNKTPDVNCKCIQCGENFILTESQINTGNRLGKFCSRRCHGFSRRGITPIHFVNGYKHSEETKNKISNKSKEMWKNKESKEKLFKNNPKLKPRYSNEHILNLWNKGYSISKIVSITGSGNYTIKKQLKEFGINTQLIRSRANKLISLNTKKHRPFQILPTKDTSIEIKIQNFLKQLGIEFFTHQYINIEHGYQCDVLIPLMNLVIECDGNYWHKYPIGRDIDNIRTNELLKKGFKVLRLWESEIKVMTIKQFGNKLSTKTETGEIQLFKKQKGGVL